MRPNLTYAERATDAGMKILSPDATPVACPLRFPTSLLQQGDNHAIPQICTVAAAIAATLPIAALTTKAC
jgi:hypothetical protein